MIKKFKNGKVKLSVPKNDWYYRNDDKSIKEEFYFEEMFYNNLYIEEIYGTYFIVDYETNNVYNFFNSYLLQNPLRYLLDELTENNTVYLYPLSKRESKQLLKQYYAEQEEMGWL